MERLQRTRLLSAAVLVLVLASGVVLGLALDVGGGTQAAQSPEGSASGSDASATRREHRQPLYRQVGELSDSQEVRIEAVIRAQRDSMRVLQREFRDAYNTRYWAIIGRTRAAIRQSLTTAQAEKYDSLLADYDRRRNDRRRDDGSDQRRN